jgi:hypothetical protein
MKKVLERVFFTGKQSFEHAIKLATFKGKLLVEEFIPVVSTRTHQAEAIDSGSSTAPALDITSFPSVLAVNDTVSFCYGSRTWGGGQQNFTSGYGSTRGYHTSPVVFSSTRDDISQEESILLDDAEEVIEEETTLPTTHKFTIGTNNFVKLRLSDEYVDKSKIVSAFEYSGYEVCVNTFPRRFLKTTNLRTLEEFYRIEVDEIGEPLPVEERQNTALFAGGEVTVDNGVRYLEPLKIATYPDIMSKLGTIPVISVDLKGVSGNSYDKALSGMKNALYQTCVQHKYLLKSKNLDSDDAEIFGDYVLGKNYKSLTESDIESGLFFLSKLLHAHFGIQPIILVDEYDTAINKAYRNLKTTPEDAGRIIDLHRDMLGNALKNNPHLDKGLVTGILRIAKANIFSGLNNLGEYSMGDVEFSGLYGFTQKEVEELIVRFGVPTELAESLKDWYNGYDASGSQIYNPWSVVGALAKFNALRDFDDVDRVRKDVLQNYWQESGTFDFVTPLFRHPDVKDAFTELAAGGAVAFDLTKQISVDDFMALREMLSGTSTYEMTPYGKDILYSYLFAAGYLTPNGKEGYYRAPNKEAMDEFTKQLITYHKIKYKLETSLFNKLTDQLQLVFEAGKDSDYEEAISGTNTALKTILDAMPDFQKIDKHQIEPVSDGASIVHDNESMVQVIIGHASLQMRSATQFGTEVYVGKGRADCLIIDDKRKKAIILELKYGKEGAKEAIDQITEKEYGRPIPKSYEVINIVLHVRHDKSVTSKFEILQPTTLVALGDILGEHVHDVEASMADTVVITGDDSDSV